MKILLQAIKSLIRKVENSAERVLNFFGGNGIIKQEHLPDGYPYGEIVEILPKTAVEFDPESLEGYIATPFTLVPGNEYTVTWNGAEYICIAQGFETGIAIGHSINMGEEPFFILNYTEPMDGFYAGVMSMDGSTSATISIHSGTATKMDVKYLPDGYPYMELGKTILPSTTVEIDSELPIGYMFNPITLVAGNEYIVTFNGAEYNSIAQRIELSGATIGGSPARGVFIGAAEGLSIGESDYPFVILVLDQPGEFDGRAIYACVFVSVDVAGTPVTISVTEGKIVKMDARYLPDPILSSPNGTRYKITVDDSGTLSAAAI